MNPLKVIRLRDELRAQNTRDLVTAEEAATILNRFNVSTNWLSNCETVNGCVPLLSVARIVVIKGGF